MRHLATRIGAQVVAEGVERSEQLATLRQYGVGIAQGNLLGAPGRRPVTYLPIAGIAEFRTPVSTTPTRGLPEARISDFMHPALTLPISTTGEAGPRCPQRSAQQSAGWCWSMTTADRVTRWTATGSCLPVPDLPAGNGCGPPRRLPDAGPAASAREVDNGHQLGVRARGLRADGRDLRTISR